MAKNKVSPTELADDVYTISGALKIKLVLGALFVFIMALFITFPVKENIATLVANAIQSNRSCPISYEKVDVSFFLPAITVVDASVQGQCYKNPGSSIPVGNIKIYFYGPSFSPLGLKFKLTMGKGKNDINMYLAAGLGSQAVRFEESTIDSNIINKFLNNKLVLSGQFDLDAIFNLKKNKMQQANIYLKSKNFSIPPQKITAFDIPNLAIENVLLKANAKSAGGGKMNIDVMSFEMGANDAPLLGQVNGKINFNQSIPQTSALSLKGKVKFSQSFIDDFAILNLILGGKTPGKEGFYILNISGTMGKPKPNIL